MLSKTSIVILGLLCKEELSAYDMLKKIDAMNMKYWFPIGNTTLYEAAVRLEKKKYISEAKLDESVAENKKIYTLTDCGREELKDTIRTLFCQLDYDTIWFCLAIMYCNVLETEELKQLVKRRREILLEYQDGITKHTILMDKMKIPYTGKCSIDRMQEITAFEIRTLDKLEQQL